MEKPDKHKIWIAIASDQKFTPDDMCTFRVGMCRSLDDKSKADFVEFFSGDGAREEAHKLIDLVFDRARDMDILADADYQRHKRKIEYEEAPKIPDAKIDSLTIGEPGNIQKPKSDEDQGLLDLNDLI